MNLLEHYIKEIKNEQKRTLGGNEYIVAVMVVNCYGQVTEEKHMFTPKEWEQAKAQGYYMA